MFDNLGRTESAAAARELRAHMEKPIERLCETTKARLQSWRKKRPLVARRIGKRRLTCARRSAIYLPFSEDFAGFPQWR